MAPSECTDSMQATQITSSCARHAARGGQRQPSSAGSAQARSSSPSRHPRLPMRRTASLQPSHCGGQANLDPAAGRGKPGCRWPRWFPGTGTGRPQPGGRHGPRPRILCISSHFTIIMPLIRALGEGPGFFPIWEGFGVSSLEPCANLFCCAGSFLAAVLGLRARTQNGFGFQLLVSL